jgi:hypothetical protein
MHNKTRMTTRGSVESFYLAKNEEFTTMRGRELGIGCGGALTPARPSETLMHVDGPTLISCSGRQLVASIVEPLYRFGIIIME